jgi:acetoacetyl-CoA synthetase
MSTSQQAPRKLWEHDSPSSTQMWKFQRYLESATSLQFPTFQSLYNYSCTHSAVFWRHTFNHFPLIYTDTDPANRPNNIVDESARMDSIPTWFPGIKMNFAENILFNGDGNGRACKQGKEDEKIACTQVREGSFAEPILDITWAELRRRVGRLANAMRARGVKRGDRVAVVASNSVDTLTVFLAVTSLGGLFSSSSTDMGVKGILDRLLQIKPRWLFVDDAAVYNGKTVDLRVKMAEIVQGMHGLAEFEGLVAQKRIEARPPADASNVPRTMTWGEFLKAGKGNERLTFESVEFSDPFLIVYSSGTTGQPKCLVHSVGGVILSGHKEGRLHRCLDESSVALQVRVELILSAWFFFSILGMERLIIYVLQYTTTGWIMYLAAGEFFIRLLLLEVSPPTFAST